MTAFDSVDSNHIDWSNSLAVTCTIPLASDSRLTSTWLDDEDFLLWSCRQRDAEIVVEYDVSPFHGTSQKGQLSASQRWEGYRRNGEKLKVVFDFVKT